MTRTNERAREATNAKTQRAAGQRRLRRARKGEIMIRLNRRVWSKRAHREPSVKRIKIGGGYASVDKTEERRRQDGRSDDPPG